MMGKLEQAREALERLIALGEDYERAIDILGGEVVDTHDDMEFARLALTALSHPPAGEEEL